MSLDSVIDFANRATNEIAKFKISITLSPNTMRADEYIVPSLAWDSVNYGDKDLDKVPDDKRGIYAFAVCHKDDVLPPHGYVLYIGIAGKDSKRSLRERYKDYLNEKKIMKRANIARMIGTWHQVLWFIFAPVDNDISSRDLKTLEQQLNTALMPPLSEGDLEADVKRKRRAFRS